MRSNPMRLFLDLRLSKSMCLLGASIVITVFGLILRYLSPLFGPDPTYHLMLGMFGGFSTIFDYFDWATMG
ncbi:hypothetical protein GGU11DRAFT_776445 [Lentinula aff. detonsa]|nr:hypothetical protein GGU11DRAFT_776445 [Lentinula aff. detonsa]